MLALVAFLLDVAWIKFGAECPQSAKLSAGMEPNECMNKSISGQTDPTNWNEENDLLTKGIKDREVQQRERKQCLGSRQCAKKKGKVKRNEDGAHLGPLGIYPCLEAQCRKGRKKKRIPLPITLVRACTPFCSYKLLVHG